MKLLKSVENLNLEFVFIANFPLLAYFIGFFAFKYLPFFEYLAYPLCLLLIAMGAIWWKKAKVFYFAKKFVIEKEATITMECNGCKGIDWYILANFYMKAPEVYGKCLDCEKITGAPIKEIDHEMPKMTEILKEQD